jgi:site-specific DNA recombinase
LAASATAYSSAWGGDALIFNRALNRIRNETVMTLQTTDGWFNTLVSSGQTVHRESAMRLSAYFGVCRVLSDSMGKLPIHVFRNSGAGTEQVNDHPLNYLLNIRPNERIYREYLEGATLLQIKHGLEADGILTGAGKSRWHVETIKRILRNEKYIGDALLQKTYTVDFLSRKRVINNGIVPQYYVENSHEAIIPRDIYMQAQEELARRANLHTGRDSNKRLYSAKHSLAGIVFCGECGEIYRRVHWNNRGCKSIVWRCVSRLEEKGAECASSTINEDALQQSVVRAINLAIGGKDSFLATLQQNISKVLDEQKDMDIESIEVKLNELQNELIRLASAGSQYMGVADEICKLREVKERTLSQMADSQAACQRMVEMAEFLNTQTGVISQYDDKLVRRLVENVTVEEGKLVVRFRSEVEIEVEI